MKIITLNNPDFAETCAILEARVAQSGFSPDLIVGIETGGRFVAERMWPSLPHIYIRSQRPSTSSRSPWMRSLLRRLPRFLADRLRILQAHILRRHPADELPPLHIPEHMAAKIAGAHRILIVDDAVDSGATMKRVVKAVEGITLGQSDIQYHATLGQSGVQYHATLGQSGVQYRTAAITVTTPQPIFKPDFALYNDNTLIRFPWSDDAK